MFFGTQTTFAFGTSSVNILLARISAKMFSYLKFLLTFFTIVATNGRRSFLMCLRRDVRKILDIIPSLTYIRVMECLLVEASF